VHVQVTRSGGIGGITLEGELDTSTLDPGERAAAEEALAALRPTGDRRPPGPDRFQYDLAVTDDDGTTRRVALHEPGVPDDLRGLLARALGRAGTAG
jgi:hypothetical protein